MAFTGAKYAWNSPIVRLRMPASGETVLSESFSVPAGTKVMQIFVPTGMAGTGTLILEALAPTETVEATQVWYTVTCTDLALGTFVALDGLPENTCVTLPISATGGGVMRFEAQADQSAAVTTICIVMSRDG